MASYVRSHGVYDTDDCSTSTSPMRSSSDSSRERLVFDRGADYWSLPQHTFDGRPDDDEGAPDSAQTTPRYSSTAQLDPRDESVVGRVDRTDDAVTQYCQVGGCPTSASYSLDGHKPATLCGYHRADSMHRVREDPGVYRREGCGRPSQASHLYGDGTFANFCAEHQRQEAECERTVCCKYPGCDRGPKYGVKGEAASVCQAHKRAGMFTTRNGQLLVATRDGNAFREEDPPEPDKSSTARTVPEAPSEAPSLPEASEPETYEAEDHISSPSIAPVTPLYRKLCEGPGCLQHPSYARTGTSRPRFCAAHKTKGMVSLKSRSCLFPGCGIRPHYGLPCGRAVYCVKHKKRGMVHLLKETTPFLKKEGGNDRCRAASPTSSPERVVPSSAVEPPLKRRRAEVSATPAEGKQVPVLARGDASDRDATDKSEHEDVKGQSEVEQEEQSMGKSARVVKQKQRKVDGKRKKDGNKGMAMPTAPVPASPSSSSLPPIASEPTEVDAPSDVVDRSETAPPAVSPAARGDKHNAKPSPLTESSGMAPSEEIKLLREARQSARVVAQASGSGRRARVPSRKVLEAAGKMQDEGVQWMTKEKKKEQLRLMAELREQRKAASAAGLKAGQVIEVLMPSIAGGVGVGGGDSGGGLIDGGRGGGERQPVMNWRKSTPEEIWKAAEQHAAVGLTADGAGAGTAGGGPPCGGRKEADDSAAPQVQAAVSTDKMAPGHEEREKGERHDTEGSSTLKDVNKTLKRDRHGEQAHDEAVMHQPMDGGPRSARTSARPATR